MLVINLEGWFRLNRELKESIELLEKEKDKDKLVKLKEKISTIKKQIEELDIYKCNHIIVKDREAIVDMYRGWHYTTECVKCGLSDQYLGDPILREVYFQFIDISLSKDFKKHLLFDKDYNNEYIKINYAKQKYIEALSEANNPLDIEEIMEIMRQKIKEDKENKEVTLKKEVK